MSTRHTLLLATGLLLAGTGARAETPNDFLAGFAKEAQSADANFKGFSAQRGEQFFKARHGGEWSCTSCHTERPGQTGRHAVTGKRIDALAPQANAERFTSRRQVEKWFKRNCNDVLDRLCTAQEKGDVLSYLMTVKP